MQDMSLSGPGQFRTVQDADQAARRSPGRDAARRAGLVRISFVLLVLMPTLAAMLYLFIVAADQFRSEASFSIRSEESGSMAAGLLGAITQVGSGSASDTDILDDFIRSRRMADAVDARLGLRAIWGKAAGDPVFGLSPDATGDDLADYWTRMVRVTEDGQSGILRVTANAFTAADARAIAAAVLAESGALVNTLSEQARKDAIRFAQQDLAEAEQRLRSIRARLSDFRRTYRMVDPEADVQGRMGLLGALQGELAQALVERDTVMSYTDPNDNRVTQANRRIAAIRARIEAERENLGLGGGQASSTDALGTYEELRTDLEFAQAAYTQALTNETVARAESRRQARYLAAHVTPTLPDTARYPQRWLLTGLTGLFLLLAWAVLMVLYYNVRDSR